MLAFETENVILILKVKNLDSKNDVLGILVILLEILNRKMST